MAKAKFKYVAIHERIPKKTSQGSRRSKIKSSSMNKHKKRSFKPYARQGR